MTDPRRRYERLIERRSDPYAARYILEKAIRTAAAPATGWSYVRQAIEPVDKRYTEITYEQGERVKNQLSKIFEESGFEVQFDYQGSVTNNTHIRFYSDIDVLLIVQDFITMVPPLEVTTSYTGDPIAELKRARRLCEEHLSNAFPEATVNKNGSKAVAINGGSLRRKVDVVICNRVRDARWIGDQSKKHCGINVLDTKAGTRVRNFPYLHNALLDARDVLAAGRMKGLIRLLKSLKNDNELDIRMSSYDICGLVYNMDVQKIVGTTDAGLVLAFLNYANDVLSSAGLQKELEVPNATRRIFCDEGTSVKDFATLTMAVLDVAKEATDGATESRAGLS